MLPFPLSPLYFKRVGTRDPRDDELQPARETLNVTPRRIWIAILVVLVSWPISIGALMDLDALFGLNDESWLKMGLTILFFIGGIYVVPAMGICRAFELWGELTDARDVLKAERIEMWERLPPEEFEDSEEAFDLPRFVEVIAGTDKIWREEWDEWNEDEEEDAQLPGLSAS